MLDKKTFNVNKFYFKLSSFNLTNFESKFN